MENKIGRVITIKIIDENDKYVFGQHDGETYRLAKEELRSIPKMGANVSGFAYENDKHQLQITKTIPKIGIGKYAFCDVVAVRKNLGVFVDIGLPNKDIVVSCDELPELTHLWPKKNDRLLIGLKVDHKGRLWGDLATEEMFRAISVKADAKLRNKDVTGTVYRLKMVGSYVLTNDYQLGFIHNTERDQEPRLGEVVNARVIGVREDGTMNLSLRPRAYEAISDDAQMLIAALQHNNGHLPYTDKSSPAEIKAYFGISKGQFKRAVGHLMKAGLVQQIDGELRLNEA
ncbi:CvfB family protein [Ligilactobacillus ceti]|uniref:S1 motif domain-containing protein n=1 Tax=Ligilactobacillus ceti DSM 22408 TaxID=1122146 RepID=A0A0R2KHX0_9LACO|nr:S1-like domain-containing RNA-binding protein [Ligilactobacillus ceti]KRN88897.1 hypothetical protein IV53_GL000867 [Ligilactobacillus ceti DSM 22408]